MTSVDTAALDRVIADLPRRYPGPGGAVAVVKDGVPIVRHGWGFANLETRQPYSPATIAPLCSITKQFTCATLLAVAPDPAALDPLVAAQLPRLDGEVPTTRDLANNQSGLRDYWALSVLCGAMPEGAFRPADAVRLIGLTRSLHFRPGTAYSYSNGNFRMLALAIEQASGRDFGDLLAERLVEPAGMETAVFAPETGALPGGAVGYEGTLATGWRAGINRLHWAGDAGLCASLDDMIAWERFIDRTREDPDSPYQRLCRPPATFRDGSPAGYHLGLIRRTRWGRAMSGHGGAIRGWRLARHWVPSERLSVAIAFNHESDSFGAAMHVIAAALGESDRPARSVAADAWGFAGSFLDDATGLLLEVAVNADGTLSATYDGGAELLSVGEDGVARGLDMSLTRQPEGILVERPDDAIRALARPLTRAQGPGAGADIAGLYRSAELESEMEIVEAGGSWFAGFRGFLGAGPMMALMPVGEDVWRLACHRSLDAPAPGDWTVRLSRANGAVTGVSVGCWLARDVLFARSGG
ncbi:D-aminopeptidase [Angulomicrobium tetraedrale]|uniref:D-aminopeptidase n=1 Tax=Ancylobacter tetraedralis TaxID=217068 RepID=A0A839YYL2_9HYPH|nr:D-aminopeptidase [Ancylobacter tetraedralis]MBB3769614.1 D-aminopeptidase [Ancylobacter tetraedralis]